MKKFIIATTPLLILSASCKKQSEDPSLSQATQLYRELCSTYRVWTDSIAQADTSNIECRISLMDNAIKKVYSAYPPDLDQRLSQAQNDTLWTLTQRYAQKRAKILTSSSLPTDSIREDLNKNQEKNLQGN